MNRARTLGLILLAIVLLGANGCIRFGAPANARDGGVFRSDENGKTWAQVTYAGKDRNGKDVRLDNTSVLTLVADPQNTALLYWGTAAQGLLRSDDAGGEWRQTAIQSGSVRAVTADPKTSGLLYAASGGVIRKSLNGGQSSWGTIYTETRSGQAVTHLLVDFFDPRNLYAVTTDGTILRSVDFGTTWSLLASLGTGAQQFFFHPTDSRIFYARTDSKGLIISRDAGRTWGELSATLGTIVGAGQIFDWYVYAPNPQLMLLATARGLVRSRDGGESWEDVATLIPPGTVPIGHVALDPSNPNVIYFTADNKLHTSHDGGAQWVVNSLPTARPVTAFFVNPTKPNQIFLGTLTVQR